MKRALVSLQILACCSLIAEPQENNPPRSKKGCGQECASEPCPCFHRGDDPLASRPLTGQSPAAYNYPANIQPLSGWDVYGDLSYLYWYINQEGLDIATTALYAVDRVYATGKGGFPIFQDTNYVSGFKIGLGANLNVDDWGLDAQYTYLRQNTTTSQTAPTATDEGYTSVLYFTGWFFDNYYGQGLVANQLKSKWNFALDWADLMLNRPFYLGKKLIATPSVGLRGSWIRQQLDVTSIDSTLEDVSYGTLFSQNSSHSWAVGPRGLIDLRWLIGMGFRLQGNAGASLLFTQFTKVTHFVSDFDEDVGASPFAITNYNCVRAMAEGNLGLGWGQYLYRNLYHIDLSATYDFNFLWGQNMLKYMVNLNGFGRGTSPYDLLMHGLTINGRFDF